MRLKNLIVVWVLLTAGLSTGREMSSEWYREKDRSWAQTRAEFPQSAVAAGAFKSRMLEIDEWAKVNNPNLHQDPNKPYLMAQMVKREFEEQSWARAIIDYPASAVSGPFQKRIIALNEWAKENNPSLYNNSNKPYLLAQMVQREFDEERARRTAPMAPSVAVVPSKNPADSSPSTTALAQEIAQSHSPNPDRPAIWMGAAIIVAITSAVAYLFFRIVRPKPGVKTATALGRRWAAWTGVYATFVVLAYSYSFQKFDGSTIAHWMWMIVFTTPVAFVVGWIIGFYKYRQFTIGSHHGNPPDALEGQPAPSPAKTGKLIPPNDFDSPEIEKATQPPMKNTEFEVMIPEGKELENGYVEMRHNTQYSLALSNHRSVCCDAEVVIDGIHVGTWRIGKDGEIRIERPAHDTGHFTFFAIGTEESRIAGITKSSENGLVSVTFTPEKIRDHNLLYAAEFSDCAQGATGLTGESKQRFVDADEIEHDTARAFTIHLRLVSARPDIRPLAPRSTPIPPPVD